jgi:CBS domain-containing protein
MDGGRIVRASIWAMTGDYMKATRIASWGGYVVGGALMALGGFAVLGALIGVGGLSPWSGLIHLGLGFFLVTLAKQSVRHAELVNTFNNVKVRDLMRPVRAVLPDETRVGDALEWYFRPLHSDQLPVVRGENLLGFVSVEDAREVPERQWDWTTVTEIMQPFDRNITLNPNLDAMAALEKFTAFQRRSMPVFQDRRLLGYVLQADIVAFLNRNAPRR